MEKNHSVAEIVDGYATIKRLTFQAIIGLFFALALLSVLMRAAERLVMRRRLTLDDYLLFAAALFLVGTAGMVYNMADHIYLWTALRVDNSIVYRLDPADLYNMLDTAMIRIDMFLMVVWTTIFLVKASFLAFFKQLIWQVSMIQTYYWAVVALTAVSWMFLVAEPYIECPKFGLESATCADGSRDLLFVSLTGLITGLDCFTDLLIVSIPVILLRRSSLRLSQKTVLGTFMCLSLVMVVIAIVRASKINSHYGVDLPWEFFWQCMEANIAVLMGSLTVFRTLLTKESKKRAEEKRRAKAAAPRSHHSRSLMSLHVWRMLHIKGSSRLHGSTDLESQDGGGGLPKIPSGTITGLRTFIWGNGRQRGDDSTLVSRQTSDWSRVGGVDESSYPLGKKTSADDSKVHLQRPSQVVTAVHVRQDSTSYNHHGSPDWTQASDEKTLYKTASESV